MKPFALLLLTLAAAPATWYPKGYTGDYPAITVVSRDGGTAEITVKPTNQNYDNCLMATMVVASNDGGRSIGDDGGTGIWAPDGGDAGTGNLVDAAFPKTQGCLTVPANKEYSIQTVNETRGCMSSTQLFGSSTTACDGHRTFGVAEAVSFDPTITGADPCIWFTSRTPTADKVELCPRPARK